MHGASRGAVEVAGRAVSGAGGGADEGGGAGAVDVFAVARRVDGCDGRLRHCGKERTAK